MFELEDGRTLRRRIGLVAHETREFALSEKIQIDVSQSVMGRLLRFGTVAFWTGDDRSRLEWTNVNTPEDIRRYLNLLRVRGPCSTPDTQSPARADASPARGGQTGRLPDGVVPAGTTFDANVILVPGLIGAFTHSGTIGDFRSRSCFWVNRGDTIGVLFMRLPRIDVPVLNFLIEIFVGPKKCSAPIRSPVSGLVLHPYYPTEIFESWDRDAKSDATPIGKFAVLVPRDEPAPEEPEWVFGDACRLVRRHLTWFQRPSTMWSRSGMSADEIEWMLRHQLKMNCRVVSAQPHYREYLEQACARFPALAPLVAHLGQPPSNGAITA